METLEKSGLHMNRISDLTKVEAHSPCQVRTQYGEGLSEIQEKYSHQMLVISQYHNDTWFCQAL